MRSWNHMTSRLLAGALGVGLCAAGASANLVLDFNSSSGVSTSGGNVDSWVADVGGVTALPGNGEADRRPVAVGGVFAGGQTGILFDGSAVAGEMDVLEFSDAALPSGTSAFSMAVVFQVPQYAAGEPPFRPTIFGWGSDAVNSTQIAAAGINREVGGGDGAGRTLIYRINGGDTNSSIRVNEATNYVAIITRDNAGNMTFDLADVNGVSSALGVNGNSIVLDEGRIGNMVSAGVFEEEQNAFGGYIGRVMVWDEQLSAQQRSNVLGQLNSYLVPEPASLVLMGLGGLLLVRRRH